MTPTTIGRHRIVRTGDSLHTTFAGPMTLADIKAVRQIVGEILADHGRCFLISDMHEFTGIGPEGRHTRPCNESPPCVTRSPREPRRHRVRRANDYPHTSGIARAASRAPRDDSAAAPGRSFRRAADPP